MPVGELVGALNHAGECADQDIADPFSLELAQDRVGIEAWPAHSRSRRSIMPRIRSCGVIR